MSPCVMIGGALVNMPGPTKVIHRESKGVKWCFCCRKRTEFFYTLTAEIEPSYYDPNPDIRCSSCDTSDGDMFPGSYREWE